MDCRFIKSLQDRAEKRHARIGIGIWKADEELISSLYSAERFCDLLVVGDTNGCVCPFDHLSCNEPWRELVRLLADGEIDGAVRGNLPAGRTMSAIAEQFELPVRRLALIELAGWAFFLGPVGIDEGETALDRLGLVLRGSELLQKMDITPKAAVLSGGRMEDRGRCQRVDISLDEGEMIALAALKAGVEAVHKGILIESCRGDDIVIAPEGVSGNLIFRTLMLLCGAQSYGAPVLMEEVFIDSSRARGNFDGPVMLAGAMAGLKR